MKWCQSMEYRTSDTAFAAYLQVKNLLKFLRLEPDPSRTPVIFQLVFHDPDEKGPQLEVEYLSGADAPANAYQAKLKTLRRSIELAKAAQARAVRRG
jgi:hypothetical protein